MQDDQFKFDAALIQYERCYSIAGSCDAYPDLPLRYGRLIARMGDVQSAIQPLKRAVDQFPDQVDVHMLLLEQYRNCFLIEGLDAIEGDSPAAVLSKYGAGNVIEGAKGLFLAGYAYSLRLEKGRSDEESYQKAVQCFQKAAQADPGYILNLVHMAETLVRLGQVDQAQQTYQAIVKSEPENALALRRLAEMARDRKDWPTAEGLVRQLIELQPDNGGFRIMRWDLIKARIEGAEDANLQFDKIRRQLQKDADAASKDPWPHFDLGYAYLTLTTEFALGEDEINSAMFEFKQVMSMAPNNPWGYWGLKKVYNKMSLAGVKGKYDEAIKICREALNRNPHDARAHFELGEAFNENYDKNQKTEALSSYKESIIYDPNMVEAHFKIASIYRILNNYDDAIVAYNRVIALDPTSHFAKDAKRSLVHIEKSRADML